MATGQSTIRASVLINFVRLTISRVTSSTRKKEIQATGYVINFDLLDFHFSTGLVK